MKEFFRKRMVALKRSPQTIPMIALVIAFGYYAFNLRIISDTTTVVNKANMGLCGFVTMLLSILVFVCFLNSFPKRQKPRFVMIALMYVMFGCMIFCDYLYRSRIVDTLLDAENAKFISDNPCIIKAYTIVTIHVILVIVVAVLIALLPVYSKLLRKINTNIDVEYTESMSTIEVEED